MIRRIAFSCLLLPLFLLCGCNGADRLEEELEDALDLLDEEIMRFHQTMKEHYDKVNASGTYYNALQNTVGCFMTPSLAEGDLTLSFKAMAYQNPGGRRTQRDILAESFRDSWGERLGCSICAYRLLG